MGVLRASATKNVHYKIMSVCYNCTDYLPLPCAHPFYRLSSVSTLPLQRMRHFLMGVLIILL